MVTGAAERAHRLLLRLAPGGPAAALRALVVTVFLWAMSGAVLAAEPSPLLVGAVGVLLCAVLLAHTAAVMLPAITGTGPVVAARDHHRALARRAVPRLRDPDAPGRTRSRAPSVLLPAAP